MKFDFEVDFSNGGSLQGQDFTLDIEGEDICEEALARYIVEDMQLLMAEEVRFRAELSEYGVERCQLARV